MQSSEIVDHVLHTIISNRQNLGKKTTPLSESSIMKIIDDSFCVFQSEPILLDLCGDFIVVGDIHGNIDDLLRIFEQNQYPPAKKYVFLGDYVDRGDQSLEVFTFLMAMKLKFPQYIYLLRGNHENASLTHFYGFYDEVMQKQGPTVYDGCVDVFHELPISAIIGGRIFCVHGGLSPSLHTLNDIAQCMKPREISGPGLFTDLVWSDPNQEINEFRPSDRGCGYYYGTDAITRFLHTNNLDLVIRSHEYCPDGISWPYINTECVDSCLTVFSNTDYCGLKNRAAVLCVSDDFVVTISYLDLLPPLTRPTITMPSFLTSMKPVPVLTDFSDGEFFDVSDDFSLDDDFSGFDLPSLVSV